MVLVQGKKKKILLFFWVLVASGVLNVKYYLSACEVVRNKILKKENHIFFSKKKRWEERTSFVCQKGRKYVS